MSTWTDSYIAPTEEQARELALAFVGDRIFTSIHLAEIDAFEMLGSVFMPIGLGGLSQMFDDGDEAAKFNPVFYEFLDKAGPRSINGLPMLMSVKTIKGSDWMEMVYPKIKAARDAIYGPAPVIVNTSHITLLHPHAKLDNLGALPEILLADDPQHVEDQLNARYAHGGGFRPIKGKWTFNAETKGLKFPGDPEFTPVAEFDFPLSNETAILYAEGSFLLIKKKDSDEFQVTRVD